jgi:hypothetical protein
MEAVRSSESEPADMSLEFRDCIIHNHHNYSTGNLDSLILISPFESLKREGDLEGQGVNGSSL